MFSSSGGSPRCPCCATTARPSDMCSNTAGPGISVVCAAGSIPPLSASRHSGLDRTGLHDVRTVMGDNMLVKGLPREAEESPPSVSTSYIYLAPTSQAVFQTASPASPSSPRPRKAVMPPPFRPSDHQPQDSYTHTTRLKKRKAGQVL